ncbi:RNase3 domain-containing protein [Microdochium bolleyi]|uniref:Dicer-like protein 1 n=1 Tax=Microdochium bolleyi TaxID=196109 RepID=A0A136ILI9_9PEZI|nr:RNase3 domain-containing protein [Microdochium bolleyi]
MEESRRITTSPREYQVELFEKAKQQNTIVVLDTGSGKTLIAALLLHHTIDQEYEDRKQGHPNRISVFLVDKIALAKQQHRVLKQNLDCNIACFAGDAGNVPRTQEFWQKQLDENMVIVCVGAVLQKCLHRSYISMEQINLLVFDEAHHAKREHPYARIITDFYASSKALRLPRIFGMTASPVDAKTDFDQAASELEGLLHSKIATVGDPSLLKSSICKAEEHTVEYNIPFDPFDTALSQRLQPLLGSIRAADKLFVYAKLCTAELGPWCADHLWRMALDENEDGLGKLKISLEGSVHDVAALNDAMEAAHAAQDIVVAHQFAELSSSPLLLTNKVHKLVELLRHTFRPGRDKCVIFVSKRLTASLLVEVLQNQAVSLPGIEAARMIGTGRSGWGEPSMTIRDQMRTIQRFLDGCLNVLVATSVAEEGLDIPDCNMVIRFDPCNTMIQYIQSRGRARQARSRLYYFVQLGHSGHRALLLDIQEQENQMRQFCATRPEDRRVDAAGASIESLLSKRAKERVFTIPSTGAKLTYRVSLELLADFAHSLEDKDGCKVSPTYIVRPIPGGFKAEVTLPEGSPVTSMAGIRETSKQLAKCAAAFDMCKELRRKKCLDEWLRSVFTKRLPAMRSAKLALTSTKVAEYQMQIKPAIWCVLGLPEEVYLTVVRLKSREPLQRRSVPLAFMTRTPMPKIGDIPLFFAGKRNAALELLPLLQPMKLGKEQVRILTIFTLRIFRDIFSKKYAVEPDKLPYYLAPMSQQCSDLKDIDPRSLLESLDWDNLTYVESTDFVATNSLTHDQLCDRYVVDPHNGARKFYTNRVVTHLRGSDPQLSAAPRSARIIRATRDSPDDIWNYSVGLWSNARSKIQRNEDLPVIEAEHISIRRNLLDSTEEIEPDATCYLVFQTLEISALKPAIVATAYTLPAMIFRLESALIALEACAASGLGAIAPPLALPALTKNSDNTDEHDQEQVNFQQGMGENYERLEFLGDSFLKMSTTIALYAREPDTSEFFQHVNRMVLINNKNLYETGLKFGIPNKIRSRAFNRRLWYPEGLMLLQGKKNDSILGSREAKKTSHTLAAKTIADVCEALIGAAYLTAREHGNMDLAVLAVTKFVNAKEHTMEKWEDFYPTYSIPHWQKVKPSAAQETLADKLKEKLGHRFESPTLARCAFTHPSYSSLFEGVPSYQQLEFLGDALLDMVCVDYLFQKYPRADPQWLTEHKMAMVSNQFLAYLCVSLDLHGHMQTTHMELKQQIMRYADTVNLAREDAEAKAEAVGLARHEHAKDFWMQLHKPPKALSDIVEAYIGAIFVDSEFDFSQVQKFFETHVLPHFVDMQLYDTFASKQPITLLINTLQERFHCQRARIMSRTVPKVGRGASVMDDEGVCFIMIHGAKVQDGCAESERYARIKVAKELNKTLEDMEIREFRRKYACDCKLPEGASVGF